MPVQKLLCSHEYEEQTIYVEDNEVREKCVKCGNKRLRACTETK